MTTKNAGEKEQGMSEGPYKITEKVGEGWYIHGLPGSILKGCLRHEREEADRLAGLLNLAHAHAAAAAARRVRELEEVLRSVEHGTDGFCPCCGRRGGAPKTNRARVESVLHVAQKTGVSS